MSFIKRWDQELEKISATSGISLNKLCPPLDLSPKDELVIDQQHLGFILLRKGFAKVSRIKNNQDHALRIATPDSLLGYGLWYVAQPEQYKITMLTKGSASFYKKTSFDRIHSYSRLLDELIAEALSLTVFLKDDRITALENVSSTDRILALLESLGKKIGIQTDNGIMISLDIGRTTMAQLAGTTVVNLSRVLTDLEEKKIIIRSGRTGIVIPNMSHLRTPPKKKGKS